MIHTIVKSEEHKVGNNRLNEFWTKSLDHVLHAVELKSVSRENGCAAAQNRPS